MYAFCSQVYKRINGRRSFKMQLLTNVFFISCAFLFKGTVDIQFIESSDNVRLEESDVYQMVESTSYFEAYRHVLKGLQEIHPAVLPFQVRVIPHV